MLNIHICLQIRCSMNGPVIYLWNLCLVWLIFLILIAFTKANFTVYLILQIFLILWKILWLLKFCHVWYCTFEILHSPCLWMIILLKLRNICLIINVEYVNVSFEKTVLWCINFALSRAYMYLEILRAHVVIYYHSVSEWCHFLNDKTNIHDNKISWTYFCLCI